MPSGTRIADYLDAIAYRRYARSVMEERRRLLGYAVSVGDYNWLSTAPLETVIAAVSARFQLRSRRSQQHLRAVVEDYRAWRRQREEDEDGA